MPIRFLSNKIKYQGTRGVHEAQEHETLQKEAKLSRLNQEQVDAAIAASRAEFQQSFLPETNQPMASSSCLRSSTPPPSPALQASQSWQPLEPSLVFFFWSPHDKGPSEFKEQAKNHNTDGSNLDVRP